MQIKHAFDKFAISFEVFPPKTQTGVENLFSELALLKKFNPAYVSVTYGAGGSTRDKTIDLSIKIKEQFSIEPLMHFTCVGNSRNEVAEHLEKVKALGLTNILALRG
ncbi:MAG TPA: methylenetetrahydrofolate reductase, partial [Spirochaetota bacterium]|nr:methylenetetrahydrofolate reductase [Spirochaetota bacterium]